MVEELDLNTMLIDMRGENLSRAEKVKLITNELDKGVRNIYDSGLYREYLLAMSKFHRYSACNCALILAQKPGAELVAGMTKWNELGRKVKKGETGITILAPNPYKKVVQKPDLDENGNIVRNDDGTISYHKEIVTIDAYKPVYVYDVSQTHGKPLPSLAVNELKDNVNGFTNLFDVIKSCAPCDVTFEHIQGGAKGCFKLDEQKIVINTGMSESQTVKTLLHEIAHSILHDPYTAKAVKDVQTREVEAESVAFVVSSYFGIDTSAYSFGYVAGWSQNKETSILKSSMEDIRKTSADLIDKIELGLGRSVSDLLTEIPTITKGVGMKVR